MTDLSSIKTLFDQIEKLNVDSLEAAEMNKKVFKSYLMSLNDKQIDSLASGINVNMSNFNFTRVFALEQTLSKTVMSRVLPLKAVLFNSLKRKGLEISLNSPVSGNFVSKQISKISQKTPQPEPECSFRPKINEYFIPSEGREEVVYKRLYKQRNRSDYFNKLTKRHERHISDSHKFKPKINKSMSSSSFFERLTQDEEKRRINMRNIRVRTEESHKANCSFTPELRKSHSKTPRKDPVHERLYRCLSKQFVEGEIESGNFN